MDKQLHPQLIMPPFPIDPYSATYIQLLEHSHMDSFLAHAKKAQHSFESQWSACSYTHRLPQSEISGHTTQRYAPYDKDTEKGDIPTPFVKSRSLSFAYAGDTQGTMPETAPPHSPTAPNALFPATGNTTNSFPNPTSSYVSCTTYTVPVPTRPPIMATTPAPCAVTAPTWCATASGTDTHHLFVQSHNPI